MEGALSAVHMDVPIVDNNARDPTPEDFKKWRQPPLGNKVARRPLLPFGPVQMKAAGRHEQQVSRPQDKPKRQPPAGHTTHVATGRAHTTHIAAGRHATHVSRPQDKSKRQPPAGQ